MHFQYKGYKGLLRCQIIDIQNFKQKKQDTFSGILFLLKKIGQIEIIQPAFYDRLSVPPVFLIMVMCVSISAMKQNQMTPQVL